ncbi:MAG: hypothetical protein Q8P68_04330 [Candidatus Peregrinibacteria bacterium]|nr:hypothetical protein [Candidatus Peregrinibacteria bacterium]MDZ4245447.1 hypothetical protein [Candidatus Gracilibacteria bacterium]
MKLKDIYLLLLISIVLIIGTFLHFKYGFFYLNSTGHAFGTDDAYITYRYANNLFDGKGLVWNQGEYVEGFSNLLYTILITPLFMFGKGNIYLSVTILNTICILASIIILYTFFKKYISTRIAFIIALLMALTPNLWVWTASGMETSFIFLITILIYTFTQRIMFFNTKKNRYLYYITLIFSSLIRIDGFIVPIISSIFLLLRRQYNLAIKSIIVTASTVIFTTIWRFIYYGDILSNTFYVKVSGTLIQRIHASINQLVEISQFSPIFIISIFIFFIILYKIIRHQLSALTFEEIYIFLWFIYWIFIGGDVFYDRFLLPTILFTIIVLIRFINKLRFCYIAYVCFLLIILSTILLDSRFQYNFNKFDSWINLGNFLKENEPNKTIAIDAAGKIPFLFETYTIDMLGLNNKVIGKSKSNFFAVGHNKSDPNYIMSLSPDLIAAWIHPNLDLAYGIDNNLYLKNQYYIKYLMNPKLSPSNNPIIRVNPSDRESIKNKISSGFSYSILSQ